MLDKALFRAGAFLESAATTIEERGAASPCSASDVHGRCGRHGRICVPCALRQARDAFALMSSAIPAAELAEALTAAMEAAEANGITDGPDTAFALHLLGRRMQDTAVTPET